MLMKGGDRKLGTSIVMLMTSGYMRVKDSDIMRNGSKCRKIPTVGDEQLLVRVAQYPLRMRLVKRFNSVIGQLDGVTSNE